jgi:MFS family permease
MVAVAMCCFQFAGVVCPPIHSVTMVKMGRKNAVIVGFVCMIAANTGLGLLSFIPDTHWAVFYGTSMIIRFIQGYGDSLYTVVALSLISSNFPESRTKYVSLLEAANGFGLIIGPPMGGLAYSYLGYSWTFYAFSIFLSTNLILVIIYIPSILNKNQCCSNVGAGSDILATSMLQRSTSMSTR